MNCLLFIFLIVGPCFAENYSAWIEYYKYPPLFKADNFERCLFGGKQESVYCHLHSLIKPDPSSELWRSIEKFSNQRKMHLSHDFITSGICIHECEQKLGKLTQEEKDSLFTEEFPWRLNQRWKYDDWVFANSTEFKKLYNRVSNQCTNLWLKEYNLTGYSEVQFCTTTDEYFTYKFDALDYLFMVITITLIVVVLVAVIVDASMNKDNNPNYYKMEHKNISKPKAFLICFSAVRNFYILISPTPNNQISQDLRFLNAIRCLSIILIVFCHAVVVFAAFPIINTELYDFAHEKPYFNLLYWGHSLVQTFFLASGALLYKSFYKLFSERKYNVKYFAVAFFYRYIRITPAYAYILLYLATVPYNLGFGGYWKVLFEREKSFCRRNMWTNLLYINNYMNPNQNCLIQSWYLAADTQLFVLCLFLFMIMFKYPKYKRVVLGSTIAFFFIVQFLVTYLNGFDGMYLMTLHAKKFLADNTQVEYEKLYTPAHTNANNYLIGVFLAMMYLRFREENWDWGRSKIFIASWYLLLPVMFSAITYIVHLLVSNEYEKPSVWLGLLAVFSHNFWALGSIIFAAGFFCSFKSPIKNFMNWSVFNTLSRLSFGVYLLHIEVFRVLPSQRMKLLDISTGYVFSGAVALIVLSNLLAVVFYTCIEVPFTLVVKELFSKQLKISDAAIRIERKQVKDNGKNNVAESI